MKKYGFKFNPIEILSIRERLLLVQEDDKSIEPIYKQFMKLITPDSVVSSGSLSKLEAIS